MLKGYVKADEDSFAWGLLGAMAGLMVEKAVRAKTKRARMVGPGVAAGAGAAAGLGARAVLDPTLVNERKAAG